MRGGTWGGFGWAMSMCGAGYLVGWRLRMSKWGRERSCGLQGVGGSSLGQGGGGSSAWHGVKFVNKGAGTGQGVRTVLFTGRECVGVELKQLSVSQAMRP